MWQNVKFLNAKLLVYHVTITLWKVNMDLHKILNSLSIVLLENTMSLVEKYLPFLIAFEVSLMFFTKICELKVFWISWIQSELWLEFLANFINFLISVNRMYMRAKVLELSRIMKFILGTGFSWPVLWFVGDKTAQNTYKFEGQNKHKLKRLKIHTNLRDKTSTN